MDTTDHRLLFSFLDARKMSYAQLADEVRRKARTKGPSKATIGHLVTGTTKSTKPEWAHAIEEILNAPSGSLFKPKASRVSQDAA